MRTFKKILLTFLIFVSFSQVSLATETNIAATDDDTMVSSEAAVLMDADFGNILYSKNADEQLYPASTTKMMTAILTVENCDLQDMVTISYWAVNSVPSTYSTGNLSASETYTVEELLNITIIASANDAAYALAEYIANLDNDGYLTDSSLEAKNAFDDSIAEFATMMNEKATEIGCTNTNFVNPNGIHDENHYSTAYDLALIGKYAYSNSVLSGICSKTTYYIARNDTTYTTTNALLRSNSSYYYSYANGMKTGFTNAAEYCIIATASKDDLNLIVVILKGTYDENGVATRETDCINLFEYGFENYSITTLISSGDVFKTVSIVNGTDETNSLDLICKDTLTCLTETENIVDVTPTISLTDVLAPISEGQVVGTITYTIDDVDYTTELLASHNVEASSTMNIALVLVLIFVILLIIMLISSKKKNRKRKRR